MKVNRVIIELTVWATIFALTSADIGPGQQCIGKEECTCKKKGISKSESCEPYHFCVEITSKSPRSLSCQTLPSTFGACGSAVPKNGCYCGSNQASDPRLKGTTTCAREKACVELSAKELDCRKIVYENQACRENGGCFCLKTIKGNPELVAISPGATCTSDPKLKKFEKPSYIKPRTDYAGGNMFPAICDSNIICICEVIKEQNLKSQLPILVEYGSECFLKDYQLKTQAPLKHGQVANDHNRYCSGDKFYFLAERKNPKCSSSQVCTAIFGYAECRTVNEEPASDEKDSPYGFFHVYDLGKGNEFLQCLPNETIKKDKSGKPYCVGSKKAYEIYHGEICYNGNEKCECKSTSNSQTAKCRAGYMCEINNQGSASCSKKYDYFECTGVGACDCTGTFGADWEAPKKYCSWSLGNIYVAEIDFQSGKESISRKDILKNFTEQMHNRFMKKADGNRRRNLKLMNPHKQNKRLVKTRV